MALWWKQLRCLRDSPRELGQGREHAFLRLGLAASRAVDIIAGCCGTQKSGSGKRYYYAFVISMPFTSTKENFSQISQQLIAQCEKMLRQFGDDKSLMNCQSMIFSPIKPEPHVEIENVEHTPTSHSSQRNDFDEFARDDEDYFRMGTTEGTSQKRKLSRDINQSRVKESLLDDVNNSAEKYSQSMRISMKLPRRISESADETLMNSEKEITQVSNEFKELQNSFKLQLLRFREFTDFLSSLIEEIAKIYEIQSIEIKKSLQEFQASEQCEFFNECKGQWFNWISSCSAEHKLLGDIIQKLKGTYQQLSKEYTSRQQDLTKLKQNFKIQNKEVLEKVQVLKKSMALLMYAIQQKQEQNPNIGNHAEDESTLKKYVKKYESMKLFMENPVSLIQIAYNKSTVDEDQARKQVQIDQEVLLQLLQEHQVFAQNQRTQIKEIEESSKTSIAEQATNIKNNLIIQIEQTLQIYQKFEDFQIKFKGTSGEINMPHQENCKQMINNEQQQTQEKNDAQIMIIDEQISSPNLIQTINIFNTIKPNLLNRKNVNFFNNYQTNIIQQQSSDPLEFINKLVGIYYQEWKSSKVFEELILKEIYAGANKKRPTVLSEIEVHKFQLHGSAPTVSNLGKIPGDEHDFHYEVDVSVRSPIEILIKTVVTLKLTESNTYQIPVSCNIIVRKLNGRIRLFFSADKNKGNWFAFVGMPAVQFNIDPVIGQENTLEVKNFPRIRQFLEELILTDFDDFCLPNKKPLNIPATIKDNIKWPIRTADASTQF